MNIEDNQRPLEAGIHTDLSGRLSYGGYLQLPTLLSAQQPLSNPPHHDEMLFIIQHQTSELWLKLLIHELSAAVEHLRQDRVWQFGKVAARCKRVLDQLTAQWSVLETLTPSEYMEFRDILGPSSGFQSLQYRTVEFLMGNKNAAMVQVFHHDPQGAAQLRTAMRAVVTFDFSLRGKARDWNWHNVAGFWSAIPLFFVVITATLGGSSNGQSAGWSISRPPRCGCFRPHASGRSPC